MLNEEVVTNTLPQNLPGGTEENYKKSSGQRTEIQARDHNQAAVLSPRLRLVHLTVSE
jgi:hypothetical protein